MGTHRLAAVKVCARLALLNNGAIIQQQKYGIMPGMEEDGQTYLLPHPAFERVILTCLGLLVLAMPAYELLRGVWPLNLASPFFAVIMLGGTSIGAVFVWAGLALPSVKLVFQLGRLEVERRYLYGARSTIVMASDIEAIEVLESHSFDGPNGWRAVIRAAGQKPICSRPLATQFSAQKLADDFRGRLGL